jgi:hypothetical protein
MGGIRRKLLVMLIIYCSGFASALYALAPASRDGNEAPGFVTKMIESSQRTVCKSQSWKDTAAAVNENKITVETINTNISKWLRFAEDKASKVGTLIKQKLDERQ